ncbi:MAG: hypothetical protein WC835_01525 [Candidatus Paceibacterota bacterium]|jgi:hypothetical protein
MDKEMTRDDDRELDPEAVLDDADALLADDLLGDLGDDAADEIDEFDEEFGEGVI